jgi:hypothetical protein
VALNLLEMGLAMGAPLLRIPSPLPTPFPTAAVTADAAAGSNVNGKWGRRSR